MLTDWNFWFSVITAIVAIAALLQTKQQIAMSNKQHLFDKRVEYYLIAKGFIQLYENNKTLLIFKDDEPVMAMDFIFAQLTNNTYLEKITGIITHPLEQPYHTEFLIKMETLKEISTKIKLIFEGKEAVFLGNYVLCYQELLFKIYQYQILLEKMDKTSQKFNLTLDKAQEAVGETQHRKELQRTIRDLKEAYNAMKKEQIEEKIQKQIKLK